MDEKVLKTLEYDKVKELVAEYAVLKGTKRLISSFAPAGDIASVKELLAKTEEAYTLLYEYGVPDVDFFDEPDDEFDRAEKGSLLSLAELIRSARLLRSSRLIRNSYSDDFGGVTKYIPALAETLYCDQYLEKDILSKILSDEKVSDNASERLYQLRRKIAKLNEQIRDKLASYIRNEQKYLQDSIVTIRSDRYVIPVKSEHRSRIKGFIHDQSSTGSTVFIEPVEVLELNNQLRSAVMEESAEIEEIVRDLSHKIGFIAGQLRANVEIIKEIDFCAARAIYAYKTKSVKPVLNERGYVNIVSGRHPLIDKNKVVPISLTLGKDYNYLLITGPNTGGKTVSLKLVGLFTLMAMSGLYVPALSGTELSLFKNVFCDVGDEQSIEQSLSTFSSHIRNIVDICDRADEGSFVLIDEIGAGTDPDEGSALAQAVIEELLERGSFGIITTHYSRLKEYAYTDKRIKNASMEFDPETFAPLYKINIGAPGSSNAIEIAARLGLDKKITAAASSLLSENKITFENVLKEAEKTRQAAQKELEDMNAAKAKISSELSELEKNAEALRQEKARLFENAKAETRRLINDKVSEADELIDQIKEILDKAELDSGDIITARTLRNKLEDKKYFDDGEPYVKRNEKLTEENAKVGVKVFVNSMGAYGEISLPPNKRGEVEVTVGAARVKAKIKDLILAEQKENKKEGEVKVARRVTSLASNEINVIGKRREEAVDEVERFLDNAVLSNLSEVRIVHGKGLKILSSAIHDLLRKDGRVDSYRFGSFGEGENGVTIVTLK